ncbi:MAG: DciA family protein, partial [Pseudomonas sp.]|nr:DciA family protein [Pseudomonas sp.]
MAFRPLTARAPGVLLREAKPLKAIFGHAKRLGHLQRLLESQLQPAAREHCHVASWREGNLLLIVTDGHWATRLRYQQKRLQRQLMAFEEFAGLTRIQFKVQPPTVPQGAV